MNNRVPASERKMSVSKAALERSVAMAEARNRVLELALRDIPLGESLEAIVRTVETLSASGVLSSILLVDDDGKHLRHGAAPSLPPAYNAAIDGIAIGPAVGSCGTAASRHAPVYVTDIATDPLWAEFKDLALSHGLRACWSIPILSAEGAVLGTFAMYYRDPREPNPADLELMDFIVRSAALLIERKKATERLRSSETRLRGVLDGMAEGFGLLSPDFTILDLNKEALRLDGRSREELIGRSHWEIYPGTEESELGARYKHAMAHRTPTTLDHRYVWPDGRPAWLEMRAYPVEEGLAVFYRDVSERHDADAALRTSEAQLALSEESLRLSTDAAEIGTWDLDMSHNVLTWSDRTKAMFGISPNTPCSMADFYAGLHPDDRDLTSAAFAAALDPAIRQTYDVEYRTIGKEDGLVRWVEAKGKGLFDAEGRCIRAIGTAIDITAYKRLELRRAALIALGDRIRDITDPGELAYAVAEILARTLNVSRAGYGTIDTRSETITIERDWNAPGVSSLAGVLQFRDYGSYIDDLKAGRTVAISDAFADPRTAATAAALVAIKARSFVNLPVREHGGFVALLYLTQETKRDWPEDELDFVRDVAERTRTAIARLSAEQDLRASEARLEAIADSIDQMVWSARPDGYHDYYNQRWYQFTGTADDPANRENWSDLFHPDDQERARSFWQRSIATGEPYRIELRLRHRSGEYRWVLGRAQAVRREDGRIVRWYGTATDIQEIVEAREVLARSRTELQSLVEERTAERDRIWTMVPDLLVTGTMDGRLISINPAWQHVLGFSEEELLSRPFRGFIHPAFTDVSDAALQAMKDGRQVRFENQIRTVDGSYRWFDWVGIPAGDTFYAVARDITDVKAREKELEEAQDALRQSQKMEAVGQLTGGIAHDFNNMLAVVIGSLDLLGRRMGSADARARRYVDAAKEASRRAALLTQRLLAFSRQQPLKPEPIDTNKLVAGMSELLRGSLGGEVRLETVLASGLWRAHADPNQLENVLLNLAVNARDAMPEGGRVTIETQNAHLDARYAAAHLGTTAGQYVLIAVSDTGSGMPEDVIAKAFDPFFTTKGVGKGTGLGLSQVYGFVKQSGGHVKIYSEQGQGTTVKIYLPRLIGMERGATAETARSELPNGDAQEVILVVEDEPAVRQFSIEALTELGYGVLEADGASKALQLLDLHPEISMLFTDIVMPDVNGARLADEVRRRRPGLRVLFTTGYTRNAIVHNGVLDAGVELIGKPFTIEELASKIREVLDKAVK